MVQLGVRGYNYPEHLRIIRERGITLVPPEDFYTLGATKVAGRANTLYLTVDIDVLDSAFAPGSGANEPGGITSCQLFSFVRAVAPYVDAVDIVEVNPLTDTHSMTSAVAARLVFDFIVSASAA